MRLSEAYTIYRNKKKGDDKLRKITAIQACAWTRDMWIWIRGNYTLFKEIGIVALKGKWPGWKNRRECGSYCPLCQYNWEHEDAYCNENCLLSNIWHGKCMSTIKSPYQKLASIDVACQNLDEKTFLKCCDKIIKGAEKKRKMYVANEFNEILQGDKKCNEIEEE